MRAININDKDDDEAESCVDGGRCEGQRYETNRFAAPPG
jgi:hypothetical protein